jgi:tetratricopeptide (TPR) repeat protein
MSANDVKCTDPRLGRLLAQYELGLLPEREREAFANHLLHCDFCHAELYALEPIMDRLRAKREAALASRRRAVLVKLLLALRANRGRALRWTASILVAVSAGVTAFFWLRAPEKPPETPPLALPEKAPSPSSGSSLSADRIARLRSAETTDALERARSAYEKGDFVRAVELLLPIAQLDPENAEAHFWLGASWLKLNRPQDAIAPLRRAAQLSVGVERERSRYYLALAYARAGHREEALRELEALIAENGVYRPEAEQAKRQLLRSGTVR